MWLTWATTVSQGSSLLQLRNILNTSCVSIVLLQFCYRPCAIYTNEVLLSFVCYLYERGLAIVRVLFIRTRFSYRLCYLYERGFAIVRVLFIRTRFCYRPCAIYTNEV